MAFASPVRGSTKPRQRQTTRAFKSRSPSPTHGRTKSGVMVRLASPGRSPAMSATRTHPEHGLDDDGDDWVRRGKTWVKPTSAVETPKGVSLSHALPCLPRSLTSNFTASFTRTRPSTATMRSTMSVPTSEEENAWLKHFPKKSSRNGRSPTRRSRSPPRVTNFAHNVTRNSGRGSQPHSGRGRSTSPRGGSTSPRGGGRRRQQIDPAEVDWNRLAYSKQVNNLSNSERFLNEMIF